jgi:hypothetical protein
VNVPRCSCQEEEDLLLVAKMKAVVDSLEVELQFCLWHLVAKKSDDVQGILANDDAQFIVLVIRYLADADEPKELLLVVLDIQNCHLNGLYSFFRLCVQNVVKSPLEQPGHHHSHFL